ncbi:cache domain-containing sensor histidine kinase [Paenibacillus guangzhouensis]|uniref:cache domain-containing sensor histidine kinase n=1 Tax=Paenibacillus guangzhouensis TaxID=1473112 RepID=UPI0012675737|nr:sensor histidine kinase [Paenibacillus guangzhouensis]
MMNLRLKLFTAFITLIIIPLVLVGVITYFVTFDLIEKRYSQQAEFSLKAISQNIQFVFSEMDKVTENGIAGNVVQTAIGAVNSRELDLSDAKQLKLNENQRNFRVNLFSHPTISFAFAYNLKDATIASIFTKENFTALPFARFKREPLYQEVVELNGAPKWVGPYEYKEITGTDPVFTQIRMVKELTTMKNIGVLITQIKNWEIERIFNDFRYSKNLEDTRFFLVNEDGLILYDTQESYNGENINQYLGKPMKFNSSYQSYRDDFNQHESVVSMNKLKDQQWYLVSTTSWNSLSQDMGIFLKWVVGILFISLLAAFLFFWLFMNRITKSIIRIVRFMRRVENGDLSARVDEEGNDELYLLSKGFNSLIFQVNNLLEEVKKEQKHKAQAELRVLQAQIKPHFLFNTLESINVLAIQNEGRKVSQMVYRLGNILRISIQDKEEIMISQEIEHLRSYLEIQKFRFDELFNFDIQMPREVLNSMILKLTLQPLVENSIQHGFEGITHQGFLQVTGHVDGEDIVITIQDNGIGISNRQLRKFQYLKNDDILIQEGQDVVMNERRGLGLRSVADRIRIQYGYRYGVYICSEENQGTTIRVRIPKYGPGEVYEAKSDAR